MDILRNRWTPYVFLPTLVGSIYYIESSHLLGLSAWICFIVLTGWLIIYIDEENDGT